MVAEGARARRADLSRREQLARARDVKAGRSVEDEASPTEPKPRTREAVAREAKIPERKLRAAAEVNKANPALAQKVRDGAMPLAAARLSDLRNEERPGRDRRLTGRSDRASHRLALGNRNALRASSCVVTDKALGRQRYAVGFVAVVEDAPGVGVILGVIACDDIGACARSNVLPVLSATGEEQYETEENCAAAHPERVYHARPAAAIIFSTTAARPAEYLRREMLYDAEATKHLS
jgi:hypothetical protein